MLVASKKTSLRLGVALWMLGMPGVFGIVLATLPPLLRDRPDAPPFWIVAGAGMLQSAILLALAVWAGARLTPKVGLASPVIGSLLDARPVLPPLKSALAAGTVTGLIAGIGLFATHAHAPAAFASLQGKVDVPLLARVLYGGITEEILLRWGVMSVLAWLGWRWLQKGAGAPHALWFWCAIVLSALLFGIGHLPAVAAQAGALDASLAGYVVFANAMFGLVFGYLFWRFGLETAMIAHGLAHVVAYLAVRLH